jgi:putative redox protein
MPIPTTIVVSGPNEAGALASEVLVRHGATHHGFRTDVSVDEGGADLGPNPHDLYDAALASCKVLTVLWYARRKNIPVTYVEVSMVRDASEERKGTYRLMAKLKLQGDLTDALREELRNVADKCPVHKLMTSVTTEVHTALA